MFQRRKIRGDTSDHLPKDDSVSILIGGVANTDDAIDNSALNPSLEMVQEFKLEANNYSAEFGYYSGRQVNSATRGGTDQFGGSPAGPIREDKLLFFASHEGLRYQPVAEVIRPRKDRRKRLSHH
jgi:hypothetical protein